MNGEILAPAGDFSSARAALFAGADAVYLGLKNFSARSSAENFDLDALKSTANFAHLLGAKVYVCLNTLVKDDETDEFFRLALAATECGADAIIMQDVFLGKVLKECCPALTLHLSTQAGCCNEYGARLAKECGFSRVVLARETSLEDIKKICDIIETEVFVQGALCSSFSGQCYFSSFAGGNSGNRGRCKQPCRKKYKIDRKGFEEYAYALSPCDLSLGKRVKELLDLGVTSLKIEGRMRREEYVSSAVRYYRAILDENKEGEKKYFSFLSRAYNRGDYTEGLAFEDRHFLSRKVQGHIGERVGYLSDGNFCRSEYVPKEGDGFKILRAGAEIGGAVLLKCAKEGFYLSSREKLKTGDEVRLTTEAGMLSDAPKKRRKITLCVELIAGERAKVSCEGFEFFGGTVDAARSAPLTSERVKECFLKVDGAPFEVSFSNVTCLGAFLPASALNELRRNFYEAFIKFLLPERECAAFHAPAEPHFSGEEFRRAVIFGEEGTDADADIYIFKPANYAAFRAPQKRCFLYLPPFFTGRDIEKVKDMLVFFEGIYCDGSWGLALAKELGFPFFAGTGFNLTNRFSVFEAKKRCTFLSLSKEIDARAQEKLTSSCTFALSDGAIKIMDLCYCPFEKTCSLCDKRRVYTLTDEEGRKFPLLRYQTEKGCRFELFNESPLKENPAPCGKLLDRSVKINAAGTSGHIKRSML